MAGLLGRLAGGLATLERLPQVLLDLPRGSGRLRFPAACRRERDIRRRLRAARLVLRAIAKAGLPWSCRRTAFLLGRTMARAGIRPTLHFGIRRVGDGRFEGHVWAGDADCGSDYPIEIGLPRPVAGWRRG